MLLKHMKKTKKILMLFITLLSVFKNKRSKITDYTIVVGNEFEDQRKSPRLRLLPRRSRTSG